MSLDEANLQGDRQRDSKPHLLEKIGQARAVAAGAESAGAVDAQGNVWVWGWQRKTGNVSGGRYSSDGYPPVMVPGLKDIVSLDLGYQIAAALAADGTVWVWESGKAPYKVFDGVKLPPAAR
jgi:alpha-tubulin suppressor-like RCC1 family protein